MLEELARQIRHQRLGARKLAREERFDRRQAIRSPSKLFAPRRARNSVRRERGIGIRQRDQHESAARPDVQRVHLERGLCHRRGGIVQLFVVVIQRLFAHRRHFARHQRVTHTASRRRRWRCWAARSV